MLGGEHRPIRMWKQGAALLDWGFAVPAGQSVGRLVAPGEVEAARASVAALNAAPAAAGPAGGGPAGGSPVAVLGAATVASAFLLVWLVVLVAARRRRARSAGRPDAEL